MDNELFEYVEAKVKEIAAAPSASAATKQACKDFEDAIAAGTDKQAATDAFADAISAKQTDIDSLSGFIGAAGGKQVFGDAAPAALAHAQERKAAGAKWCDCAACRPCHELLAKLGREEADVYL